MLGKEIIKEHGYKQEVPYVIYIDGTFVELPVMGLDMLNVQYEYDRKYLENLYNIEQRCYRLLKLKKLSTSISIQS